MQLRVNCFNFSNCALYSKKIIPKTIRWPDRAKVIEYIHPVDEDFFDWSVAKLFNTARSKKSESIRVNLHKSRSIDRSIVSNQNIPVY